MPAPLLRRLEENLAPIFGRGMAPYVIRRALRHLGKSEEQVHDTEIDAVIVQIERSSLERVFGAQAHAVAAEISMHVHRGSVLDAATAQRFSRGARAVDRAQELI